MVAINFQEQFAELVSQQKKQQTIRKRYIEVGQSLQLFTGQRTKQCKKISEKDPVCISCQPITIARSFIKISEIGISFGARRKLALADGFLSADRFLDFFCPSKSDVFEGYLIKWRWDDANSTS